MEIVGRKSNEPNNLQDYLANWSVRIPCSNNFCEAVLGISAEDLKYPTDHGNSRVLDQSCMIRCLICNTDQRLYVTHDLAQQVIPRWVFIMTYEQDQNRNEAYVREP